MTRFTSILVAMNFASRHAVRRAASIAAQHDARLTLLHVVDPFQAGRWRTHLTSSAIEQQVAQAHAVLGGYASEVADWHDVPVRTEVQVGDPLKRVRVHAHDTDLVVVASGRKRLEDLFFPTVVERLSQRLRTPVLVVKRRVQGRYLKVLIAVDFTRTSEGVVQTAMSLASSAKLHLFHALSSHPSERLRADVPPALVREYEDRDRRNSTHRLRSLAGSLNPARVDVSVEHGHPVPLTLQAQERIGADLVVMGKNGRSAIADFLLGSVANRAVSEAPCDVLVIPAASAPRHVMGARSTGQSDAVPLFGQHQRRSAS